MSDDTITTDFPDTDEPETGLFTWKDDEGHKAYGCAFPDGSVWMLWDRETWPEDERLVAEHFSGYGTVGDVVHANGGRLEWGGWDR